jgi:hypothetical protein
MVNPSPVSVARASAAVAVLRECDTWEEARPRLLAECDESSGSALRAVFARAGYEAPSAYLRGALGPRGAPSKSATAESDSRGGHRIEEPPVYSSRPPAPRDTDPAPPPAAAANDEEADIATSGVYTGAAPPDYDDDEGETVRRRVAPGEWPDRTWVDRSPVCAVAEPSVPFREERIFFVPDSHFPYVDRKAWGLAMRFARWFQPHRIVVGGDYLDCYTVSSHSKSPTRYSRLVDEIADSMWGLDELDTLGAERKDFLLGNHCFRLQRLIDNHCPALQGLKGTTIEEIMSLQSRGWVSHKYMVELLIGKLRVCHDYGQAGKYSLGRAVVTMDSDIVQNHTHLAQTEHRVSKAGENISGNSFGWLGDFEAIDYCHRGVAMHTWAHACGGGITRPDGSVRREVVRLGNGRPTFDGQAC